MDSLVEETTILKNLHVILLRNLKNFLPTPRQNQGGETSSLNQFGVPLPVDVMLKLTVIDGQCVGGRNVKAKGNVKKKKINTK